MKIRAREILKEARECLEAARVGLQEARRGPYHLKAGVRNVAVFGRMSTFQTNNLKGKIDGFEAWDKQAKAEFFSNPIARAMVEARNSFEKASQNPISSITRINSFGTSDLNSMPRPKNAVSFFVGDRIGGSGWMIKMENGDMIPFYIELPPNIGRVDAVVRTAVGSKNVLDASEEYLSMIQHYLDALEDFCERASR